MAYVRLESEQWPGRTFEVRVLSSWAQRLRGLLGTSPKIGAVMLARCSSVHTFGMAYDLDLAFVGKRGEVLEVCAGVPPGEVRSHPGAFCVMERPASRETWPEVGESLWVSAISAESLGRV